MVVNSISFLLFFAVVFIVYYLLKGRMEKDKIYGCLLPVTFFTGILSGACFHCSFLLPYSSMVWVLR